MKKLIRLTESDIHRIVKESVNRILRENYVDLPDGYDKDWQDMANLAMYNGPTHYGYGEAGDRLRHLNANAPNKKQQIDSAWSDQKFDDFQKERYNSPLSKRNNNVDTFDGHDGMYEHPAISDYDAANRERGVNIPKRKTTRSSTFDSPGRLMFNDYGEYIGQNN